MSGESRDGSRQRTLESAQSWPMVSKIYSEREIGLQGLRCYARNGLKQGWHSLFLFLEFQIQGRIRAPRVSVLTL